VTRHHLIPQSLAIIPGERMPHQRLSPRHLRGLPQRFVGFEKADIRDPRNIVPLCRPHHDAIERGVLTGLLRRELRDVEVAHIRRVAGPQWLQAHYPDERKETST
jgi:hypothetical protein